ncbi:MAG: FecR domain-containing protein [Kiritimatiellae bacterium]|nr:FecR domain-containing protein [Kiritimatiellia bacterium]
MANDTTDRPDAEPSKRFQGRMIACEGILRSRFGARPSSAGAEALRELRARQTEPLAAAKQRAGTRAQAPRSRLPDAARPWGWRLTGIAAALLAGLGLLFGRYAARLRLEADRMAAVQQLAGRATVQRGKARLPLRAGQALYWDDRIVTEPANSAVLVSWDDGKTLELGPETAVEFRARPAAEARQIHVSAGIVTADVPDSSDARQWVWTSPHAEVRVVGTRFVVEVRPAATRVETQRGTVQVTSRQSGQSAALAAGSQAMVGRELAVAARPESEPQTAGTPGRVRRSLQALYTFTERGGRIIRDRSGMMPALDLTLTGRGYRWVPGGGLSFTGPDHDTIASSAQPPARLLAGLTAGDQITVELWIRPAESVQRGPARILVLDAPQGLSKESGGVLNFEVNHGEADTMRVGSGNIVFRLRTSTTDWASMMGTTDEPLRTAALSYHVVCTYSSGTGMRIYVDGDLRAAKEQSGLFETTGPNAWHPNCTLSLGNRTGLLDRDWQGDIYLAAIYSRALSPAEIRQNYEAGQPNAASEIPRQSSARD